MAASGTTWNGCTGGDEMRLFTAKGDGGDTDLLGARVDKDDPRIELIGQLDETTSAIGLARALATRPDTNDVAIDVQRDLYRIMAELAFTPDIRPDRYIFGADRVDWLSALTDELSAEIELPRQFIIPGETVSSAAFDVARTVVRRAERHAVALHKRGHLDNPEILRYLNRLSSLLFMLARAEDAATGETPLRAKEGGRG
jgi:cob(I)alamin adenosyltransferase